LSDETLEYKATLISILLSDYLPNLAQTLHLPNIIPKDKISSTCLRAILVIVTNSAYVLFTSSAAGFEGKDVSTSMI
jgi:hypothetical protein